MRHASIGLLITVTSHTFESTSILVSVTHNTSRFDFLVNDAGGLQDLTQSRRLLLPGLSVQLLIAILGLHIDAFPLTDICSCPP